MNVHNFYQIVRTISIFLLTSTFCLRVWAESEGDAILGKWILGNGDVCVEVQRSGEEYVGNIVWLKEPIYPKGHELEGQRKIDRFNPDVTKKNRPLIGLTVLSGLTYSGNNQWGGGTVYDADSGKTYRCIIYMISPNELDVRGYIGLRFIGRSVKAYRITSPLTHDRGRYDLHQERRAPRRQDTGKLESPETTGQEHTPEHPTHSEG